MISRKWRRKAYSAIRGHTRRTTGWLPFACKLCTSMPAESAGASHRREEARHRAKPYLEKLPRLPLKPLPFVTFGELPALDLALWHRPHGGIGSVPPISTLGLTGNNLLRLHS